MDIELRADVPLDSPPQELPLAALVALCLDIWRVVLAEDPMKAMAFLGALPRRVAEVPIVVEARKVTEARVARPRGVTGANGGDDPLSPVPMGVTGSYRSPSAQLLSGVFAPVTTSPASAVGVVGKEARRSYSILIWTGPAWEHWGPKMLDEGGIGGSETAAVRMAAELAALGHRVTVASDCAGREGSYGAVRYIRQDYLWAAPKGLGAFDVLVVSRQAWALSHFEAKAKLLWVHDVHVGEDSAKVRGEIVLADRVLALSSWHAGFLRQSYPWLAPEKIAITRNAVDPSRFAAAPSKVGNQAVYASSPDRGLARLLELWPGVRARVPDAVLHVCYGFKNWERMTESYEEGKAAIAGLKEMIASTPSVVDHGRIGQKELAALYLASKVWAYPTWFTETSCIAAREAQAAGCVPVTTRLAALEETVHHGMLLEPPCQSPAYGDAFVAEVVRLMTDEPYRRAAADAARAAEIGQGGWDVVARQWESICDEIIAGKEAPPPPAAVVMQPVTQAPPAASTPASSAPEVSSPASAPAAPARKVTRWRPLRVAVTLGRLGAAVHGIMDVDDVVEGAGSFRTGTQTGFFTIAHALAERGHVVDAFADLSRTVVGSRLGGANFYRLDDARPDDTYDGYLSINEPDVLRDAPRGRLRAVAMWLNDFSFCAKGWDEHVDLYVCPSRSLAAYLGSTTATPKEKLEKVIPLGVNLERFPPGARKEPGTMIWASSPDRGLHHLLGMFPEVREKVPGATLKIYYRIDPWIAETLRRPVHTEAEGLTLERASSIASSLAVLGRDGRGGVTVVGPVPPKAIAEALSATTCLPYTCDTLRYTEGFSLATLEGCAAGCVPLVSAIDALPEVYGGAAVMIPPTPSEHRAAWIENICRALTNESWAAGVAERARTFARAFSRQEIGRMWEELIRDRSS